MRQIAARQFAATDGPIIAVYSPLATQKPACFRQNQLYSASKRNCFMAYAPLIAGYAPGFQLPGLGACSPANVRQLGFPNHPGRICRNQIAPFRAACGLMNLTSTSTKTCKNAAFAAALGHIKHFWMHPEPGFRKFNPVNIFFTGGVLR